MIFSFLENKPSLSFVFDIRDTFVSIAATRFTKDKKPEIILCQNFELDYRNPQNSKNYTNFLLKILDKAVISVRKDLAKIGNKEKIGAHYFFLGSPWCISKSKTIKIIKDRPFEIDNKILSRIIIEEESSALEKIGNETQKPNWAVLEEKIIQSRLNGYKVENIFGKKASDLTSELFISFAPKDLKDKLDSFTDEKIGKNIKGQNNSCISASYSFLRDLYSNKNDFIYIDLGKLITDIYVVRDDVIFGVASFPFGEENIIQTSLSKTSLSRDIFMSHINIGQDKKFAMSAHNNGEDLLKNGFNLWENKLKDSILEICTETNIPDNMLVITNSNISNMLVKELQKKKNFEMLGTKIEVSTVSEGVINSFILNGKTFLNEPYVKMDLVFLDNFLKKD